MRAYCYFILLITSFFFFNAQAQIDTTKKNHTDTSKVIRGDTFRKIKAIPVSLIEPKREFRGVWIATVVNIDWPSDVHLSVDQQKKELLAILDADQRAGINAIILQVRPAADAFYAKGSTSVARFFEILCAIKNEGTRRSFRAAAPIWIPGVPVDHGGLATIAVACPECLRTFPHCLRDAKFLNTECCCPHCHYLLQLAIARPTMDMDQTGIGMSAKTVRISVPAYIR